MRRASRRCSRSSTRSPRSRTRRRSRTALGGTIRADVDVLNATNFHTANIFGLWIAQDLDDPTRYAPFLLQGGLGMPDRDYYARSVAEDGRDPHEVSRARRSRCWSSRRSPTPTAKAKRIVALETKIAKAHASRVDSEDVHKGDNHWKRADLDDQGAGPRLDDVLRGGRPRRGERLRRSGSRSATTGIAALVGERADRRVEGLPHVPRDRSRRARVHAEGVRRRELRVLRRRAVRRAEAAAIAGSAPSTSTSGALGMAVGKLYVEKYFPPADEGARGSDGQGADRRDRRAHRSPRLDVAGDEGEGEGEARVAQGRRRLSRQVARLQRRSRSSRGDALGNAQRAEQFDYSATSPSSASRSIAASG